MVERGHFRVHIYISDGGTQPRELCPNTICNTILVFTATFWPSHSCDTYDFRVVYGNLLQSHPCFTATSLQSHSSLATYFAIPAAEGVVGLFG